MGERAEAIVCENCGAEGSHPYQHQDTGFATGWSCVPSIEYMTCPCCHGKGDTWPEKRGYHCVMCNGENVIDVEREPEWDHIVSSAG